MNVDFFKDRSSIQDDITSKEDALCVRNNLMDYYLYYLKLQSKYEFFYWKLVDGFLLAAILIYIMQWNGWMQMD